MTGHCSCLLLLKQSFCLRQPVSACGIKISMPPECSQSIGKTFQGLHTCYTCTYICVCGEASLVQRMPYGKGLTSSAS